jgi:tetratricopeptide (TPR) repeat protein
MTGTGKTSKGKSPKATNAPKKAKSAPDPRGMEGMLRGLLGEQPSDNPLRRAEEIMYDAWESPSRSRRVKMALEALKLSADCADAFNLLAEEGAESLEETLELYTMGVEAGERALGKKGFKEYAGHFWGFIETRPYMRARFGQAYALRRLGRTEEAVGHFTEMLRLNPGDNQGIRYLLLPLLLELGRDDDAEKLHRRYDDDGMASWMYTRALLDFRKKGDGVLSRASLAEALKANSHVPAYLTGRKKPPRALPETYGIGNEDEAVICVHECGAAWSATPGALAWLAAAAPALQAGPAKGRDRSLQ